ncbi:amino acid adenylation domain-containing protein, partial [Streptosporangium fragile]|uniref:non-ribosomal peptide synthetase n=1 Tax=Streptosporangium fragile TaxID=46186 RepID=UPI0031E7286A
MSALSYTQERLWFLDRLTPGDGTYNMVVCERLRGPLDAGALERALGEIAARHEALRTVFPEKDGLPVATVLAPAPVEFERLDLTDPPEAAGLADPAGAGGRSHLTDPSGPPGSAGSPGPSGPSGSAGSPGSSGSAGSADPGGPDDPAGGTPDARLAALLAERSNRPFDLAAGPLLRASLIRTGPDDHVLLIVVHHIAGDAWSIEQIMFAELASLYTAFKLGLPSPLPPPAGQYADHARRQRENPADVAAVVRELRGVPVLELPTDRPRPAVRTTEGDLVVRRLPLELWRRVTELARAERCTPFMTLLAAYQVLLSRHTGQDDFCVGTPVAGRDEEETESVFGVFINTLALRADLSGDPTFRETLRRVRRRAFTMYGHAAVPFERVVSELGVDRDPARTPVFQTMLMLGNPDAGSLRLDGVRTEPVLSGLAAAKVDLALDVIVYATHVQLMFSYSTGLFDRATVERMGARMETLLRSIVADPGRRLSELEVLPPDELATVLGESSGESSREPDGDPESLLLDRLIARQAARTPGAPAVIAPAAPAGTPGEPAVLTYAELDRAATAVAARLRSLLERSPRPGAGPDEDVRVALALPAGPEAIVALLGVLKAGAAYVPLDPGQPAERLAYLLADSGAAVAIADASGFAGFAGPVVTRSDLLSWAAGEVIPLRPPTRHPDRTAYVIYTSGSTGRPKGVVVGHRTLSHLARSFRDLHGFGPGERVLVVPPLSFDASAGDIFPALISGATLVLHPAPASLTGPALDALCAEHAVTMVDTASAIWQQWVEELDEVEAPITTMMVGGESVPLERLRTWAGLTGGRVAFHNHYGPTEATVCATSYRTVDGAELGGATHLPIGTALPHTRVYVLDRHGNPAPIGVPGEVHIGGECLAHGYLGRPGATAERFLPDPFSPRPGARMYATGDLGRYRPDGTLEFLGRTDRQLKIHGNRIEPGEVEAACLAHPGVREAVVTADGGRLVAYLVGEPLTAAGLRAFLAGRLPGYMIPGAVVMLPALPITAHGKIDVRALPEPGADGAAPPYEAPREGTERVLAAIWADALGTDPGRADNFFDLGGHSLLAPRIVSRIAAELGVTVPMTALFAAAGLARLGGAADVRRGGSPHGPAAPVVDGSGGSVGPVADGPPGGW